MRQGSHSGSSRRAHLVAGWPGRTLLRLLCFALVVSALPSFAAVAQTTPVIVFDSFTDAAGTDLEDHTGELGASWTVHPDYDSGIDISPTGAAYNGTNTKVYLASGVPPNADYDVEADLIIKTNQDHGGVVGRVNPNADTYYAAEGSSAQGIWQLRKRVNGSWTLLKFVDTDFEPGRTYRLRLELRAGSQKFYVDDVLVLEDDDNDPALRQTGRAGIRLSSDKFHLNDPSRGWQLDNFRVTASGPADTTPPAAPANLTASTDPGGILINLDWDNNTDFDLAGYDVYRAGQPGGPYTKINASLLSTSQYVDATAPGGTTSYYQVVAIDLSDNASAPSNEASATRPIDESPPSAPANLTATGTFTGIDLDWDASPEPDVAGYRIYRASQAGGPFAQIDEIDATASFFDSAPAPGETAYYQVTALDSSGNESGPSATASATRIDASYGLMVSASPNRANAVPLDGETVSGNIYAFTAPDTPDIQQVRFFIDDPSMDGNPTRVEGGAPYDLGGGTVSAAAPFNTSSLADGPHTLTAAIELNNGAIQVAHATFIVDNAADPPGAHAVPGTIQAEDYDLGGQGVAYHDTTAGNSGGQYRTDNVDIQTTTDAGGGYNIGWVRTGEWLRYTVDVAQAGEYTVTFRTATSYSNRRLHLEIDGTNISGPVTAPNTGGTQNWGNASATVQLPAGIVELRVAFDGDNINFNYFTLTANEPPPPPPPAPAAPQNLSATLSPDETTIALDWDDNAESNLTGYRVYRATAPGGPFNLLAELGTTSAHVDGGAPVGVTMYYQVTALNPGGESPPSNQASATRPADTTPPAAPTGLSATGTLDGISLDWANNTEGDLAGYRVYRGDQAGGPFTLLQELGTTSAYTDNSVAPGATAHYRVTAFDTAGNESAPSDEASATRLEAGFALLISAGANRANPLPLDGETVAGDIYVFTGPDQPNIVRVRFYLDNPTMSGSPFRTENGAPYDFNGSATNGSALAYSTVGLPNGPHTITAAIEQSGGPTVVIHATFTVDNELPEPDAHAVPGLIQAEDYDIGGEGVAYHDTTAGNSGGQYRTDNVDIQTTSDTGGGYNVGWVRTGEWLRYTIDVEAAGEYTITLRVATQFSNRKLHLELDGQPLTGSLTMPNTGGTQSWANTSVTVTLPAGIHTLTLVAESDNINVNHITIAPAVL